MRVTVWRPASSQSKADRSISRLAIPQASVELLSICSTARLACPASSSGRVMVWVLHRAFGAVLSWTVTLAEQVLLLPLWSVTVSTTGCTAPISEQSKVSLSTVRLAIPQASEEPLSASKPVIVALPLSPSCTVISWQAGTGGMLSMTVTVALQVAAFPLTSVAVRVMVLTPTSAH